MDKFILMVRAISDPTRVRMLKLLEHGELCVCEIMDIMGLVQSTASKHLGILKSAGLVEGRKDGTWTHYRLPNRGKDNVSEFLGFVKKHLNNDTTIKKDRRLLAVGARRACEKQ